MSELKPCPFCGGEAWQNKGRDESGRRVSWVKCRVCDTLGKAFVGKSSYEDAAIWWNTRHERTCEGCSHVTERTDMPSVCETCNRAWNDHYAKVVE